MGCRQHWKKEENEEKEKRRIKGKPNSNKNIFGFTCYMENHILLEDIVWKDLVYTIAFNLQFWCFAEYLKYSNDTS